MINIHITEAYEDQVDPAVLERAAQAVLLQQEIPDHSELSIVVEGDEAVHDLNQQYLGIDAPTDVLSFPGGEVDPDTGNTYLGDIVISLPRAKSQAEIAGHPLDAEMQLLVVHGVLHLLGMDHAAPEEKESMWAIQQGILDQLGVHLNRLPED